MIEKLSNEHKVLHKQSKEASINCESAAYLGYKLGLSLSVYENIVAEIHLPDRNVGLKNHLKDFRRNFLDPMYDVLHGIDPGEWRQFHWDLGAWRTLSKTQPFSVENIFFRVLSWNQK